MPCARGPRSWGAETFAASTGRVYPAHASRGAPAAAPVGAAVCASSTCALRCIIAGCGLPSRRTLADGFPGTDRKYAKLRKWTPSSLRSAAARGRKPDRTAPWYIAPRPTSGVAVTPLQAANCGWELAWPAELLAKAEGPAAEEHRRGGLARWKRPASCCDHPLRPRGRRDLSARPGTGVAQSAARVDHRPQAPRTPSLN